MVESTDWTHMCHIKKETCSFHWMNSNPLEQVLNNSHFEFEEMLFLYTHFLRKTYLNLNDYNHSGARKSQGSRLTGNANLWCSLFQAMQIFDDSFFRNRFSFDFDNFWWGFPKKWGKMGYTSPPTPHRAPVWLQWSMYESTLYKHKYSSASHIRMMI